MEVWPIWCNPMAIVSSMKNEDREIVLKVDLQGLNLPASAGAMDAITGETIPMQAGALRIPLGAEKFRMVILR